MMNDSAQERAAQLLVSGGALLGLSLSESRVIVGYMHPQLVNAGEVLIREGEASDSGFMALVVDGEVTVENASASDESVVVTVLGPGSLIGEMGFIANVPRSATCVATTDLALAVLTRDTLLQLTQEQPKVAVHLLMTLSQRMAEHLRESNRKLSALMQVTKAMKQELEAVHSVNKRLLDQRIAAKKPASAPAAAPVSAPAQAGPHGSS